MPRAGAQLWTTLVMALSAAAELAETKEPTPFDAMRATLIGVSHFGLVVDGAVLVLAATVLLGIGSYLFSRIQV